MKKWPFVFQGIAKKYLQLKYAQKIENEKRVQASGLKIRQKTIVISEEENEENNQKRAMAKDILFTEYNRNIDRTLHRYFLNNRQHAIHKWFHYFDIYEKHFSRFRGKDVHILEIGVQNGGSARMWHDYFSNGSNQVRISGVDVDSRCKALETEDIKILSARKKTVIFCAI